MYDIGEDIISVADVEAEVSADDCCRHFQDDGRYKHLACRPHEHNARSTFAYVPVAPFGNLQCQETVSRESNLYLPSEFDAAFANGLTELDKAIIAGELVPIEEGTTVTEDPVAKLPVFCCIQSYIDTYT